MGVGEDEASVRAGEPLDALLIERRPDAHDGIGELVAGKPAGLLPVGLAGADPVAREVRQFGRHPSLGLHASGDERCRRAGGLVSQPPGDEIEVALGVMLGRGCLAHGLRRWLSVAG